MYTPTVAAVFPRFDRFASKLIDIRHIFSPTSLWKISVPVTVTLPWSLLALDARCQWASLRGRILDSQDGEPLPGVHVLVSHSLGSTGTIRDRDGYCIGPRMRPGEYSVRFSFVGYVINTSELTLDFGQQVHLNVEIAPDRTALTEVVVETERPEHENNGTATFLSIRPSDLKRLPLPGLSADPATYLVSIPRIMTVAEQGGQLYVRCGTPTQNLSMVDGVPIYQPLHIVGFYSAFPADIV